MHTPTKAKSLGVVLVTWILAILIAFLPFMEIKGRTFYDAVVIGNNPMFKKTDDFERSDESAVEFSQMKSFVARYSTFDTKSNNISNVFSESIALDSWIELEKVTKFYSSDILKMEKYLG